MGGEVTWDPVLREPLALRGTTGEKFRRRSATTFVLPFHYNLCAYEGTPRFAYEPREHPEHESSRRTYFTSETSHALFDRARRFDLRAARGYCDQLEILLQVEVGGKFGNPCGEHRQLHARVYRTELVLFEPPALLRGGDARDGADGNASGTNATRSLQVGFLVVEVHFDAVSQPGGDDAVRLADILPFNESFRYLASQNDSEHDKFCVRFASQTDTRDSTQPVFRTGRDEILGIWQWLLEQPIRTSSGFKSLVSPQNMSAARRALVQGDAAYDTGWLAHSDNRAFVWTCAVLASPGPTDGWRARHMQDEAALRSEAWVSLVNVDTPSAGAPSPFEREWAREHSYTRWAASGTYYGFCQHAGAVLCEDATWFAYAHTIWRNQYLDQTLLLLYLRAVAFGMSGALSEYSVARWRQSPEDRFNDEETSEQALRDALAFVTNVYRYPLYSNQQQGEEMFLLARKAIGVDRVYGEIEAQVAMTDQLLRERWQSKLNRVAAIVQIASVVATATGVAGLTAGLLTPTAQKDANGAILSVAGLISAIVLVGALYMLRDRLDEFHEWWKRGHQRK